jgi:hypothetical protein
MHRFFNRRMLLLILIATAGCGDANKDDTSLPPRERAARFDRFAKQGMTWSELAIAFPPDRFSFGVVDEKGQHIGGTPWTDFTTEKFQKEMGSINYDEFEFQYNWSKEPRVFYDITFTKDGKLYHIDRTGEFN